MGGWEEEEGRRGEGRGGEGRGGEGRGGEGRGGEGRGGEGKEVVKQTIQHCLNLEKPPKVARRHLYNTTRP